jgi:hypothetical protein
MRRELTCGTLAVKVASYGDPATALKRIGPQARRGNARAEACSAICKSIDSAFRNHGPRRSEEDDAPKVDAESHPQPRGPPPGRAGGPGGGRVDEVAGRRNARNRKRIEIERAALKALPDRRTTAGLPGQRCSMNTTFQLSYRSGNTSPAILKVGIWAGLIRFFGFSAALAGW